MPAPFRRKRALLSPHAVKLLSSAGIRFPSHEGILTGQRGKASVFHTRAVLRSFPGIGQAPGSTDNAAGYAPHPGEPLCPLFTEGIVAQRTFKRNRRTFPNQKRRKPSGPPDKTAMRGEGHARTRITGKNRTDAAGGKCAARRATRQREAERADNKAERLRPRATAPR